MSSSQREIRERATNDKGGAWHHQLRARISLGFGVVLALHLIVAIVGHIGISEGRRNLEEIEQERQWTDGMVAIDRVVREVQQGVMLYAFTGHESLEARVSSLHDDLRERLDTAILIAGEERDLVEMQGVLSRYVEQFRLAREDRAKRRDIVDRLLISKGKEAEAALRDLGMGGSIEGEAAAQQAHLQFLYAQAEALEYVHRLDYGAIRSAGERMEVCAGLVDELIAERPAHLEQLIDVQELVHDYAELLHRLVQRTRGYLHLVNVVIAGETAEFLRLSERVRQRHVARLDEAYAAGIRLQMQFERVSLWVSIVTIAAGLIAGALITRSVVGPIHELADVFVRLGAGERAVAVPGLLRKDEIGEMAHAAEVFRQKNADTSRLLEEARRSNQDLEQFAAIASHDLQEPLRMVASYVQLIEKRYASQLDVEAREFIGYAVDGTHRMKTLINDLLTYSRVGKSGGSVRPIRVSELLDEVKKNLEVEICEAEAQLVFDGEDPPIWMDRSQLLQVIQNLVSNAIKFRSDETPHVVVGSRLEDTSWLGWVSDNGIGIKEEHLGRVFDVFRRLHSRDEYKGTGIGLAVCRRLVERRGGKIWVESTYGKGSTVFFSIPRAGPPGGDSLD